MSKDQNPPRPRTANDTEQNWALPIVEPDHVGLCPERLQRASGWLDRFVANRHIAGGIILAARRGAIAHVHCAGQRDVEAALPMRVDSLFRIYSMTKPIVCVAVLMLYEEGLFYLDEPVSKYIPEFADLKVSVTRGDGMVELVPPKRPVTIHDLLTHTGGLSYAIAHEAPVEGLDLPSFITRFCQVPLTHHPGERWQYSSSHDVLGRLIEIVSGMPLDQFLSTRIFTPLGMVDTDFRVPPGKRERFTALYTHNDASEIVRREEEDHPYLGTPRFLSGGSGLVSTISDYLRFCLMLLHDGELAGVRILGRKTVELLRVDHLPPGHPGIEPFKFGYGLGVSVLRSLGEKQGIGSVGEFGWGGAASTEAWIDPQEEMVCLVMTQVKAPQLRITKRFKDAYYQAIIR